MVFIQRYWLALLIAAFVGLCASAPAVLAPRQLGDAYEGMQYMYQDDEDIYRARIQEVLEGHGTVVSPFFFEYKNEPSNVAPIGEWLYAIFAYVFGLSAVLLAAKFFLPASLFLLVFFFTRRLLGEDHPASTTALSVGLLVTLGYDFIDYGYVRGILEGGAPGLSVWSRTINPILGAVALFGLLILVWNVIVKDARSQIIPAGALVAAMVGYYFAWGMALSVLGVLFLAYSLRREFNTLRDLVLIGLVSLAASAPYFYAVLSTFGGEEGTRASMKTGMVFTHEFVFNKFLFLATLLVAICFAYSYWRGMWREHEHRWIFIVALILSGWIAFNEQVITGRQIWFHHFVQYTIPFSYVAVLAATHLSFRHLFPRLWVIGIGALMFLCAAYGLYGTTAYAARLEHFTQLQEYGVLMRHLNTLTKPCVVMTVEKNEDAAKLIPAYTHCDVYFSSVVFYAVPDERIRHNFLLQTRLQGITPENVEAYFLSREHEVRGATFTNWDELFGRGNDVWFEERVQELTNAYTGFVKGDLEQQVRAYRVDTIVSKDALLSHEILKELPSLSAPQPVGNFYLYEFK